MARVNIAGVDLDFDHSVAAIDDVAAMSLAADGARIDSGVLIQVDVVQNPGGGLGPTFAAREFDLRSRPHGLTKWA